VGLLDEHKNCFRRALRHEVQLQAFIFQAVTSAIHGFSIFNAQATLIDLTILHCTTEISAASGPNNSVTGLMAIQVACPSGQATNTRDTP
jgi:hypothetical protein